MKQEEMKQEEMKRYFLNESRDVSIAIENFVVDDSTTENTLSKAKSSAKKLIEKIDEYLESQKPKFKVGDYVTDTSGNNPYICKIEEIEGHELVGNWYCFKDNHLDKSIVLPISTSRLSTPEEIAEYEIALNFYKLGRDPFVVEKGDLIVNDKDNIIFVINPSIWTKKHFTSGRYTLLKTVEKFKEWVGADDE